jgi:PAS domain S-box-containing protein
MTYPTTPALAVHEIDSALAALLFETASVGVAVIDGELRYAGVNRALAAMNGRPAAAHVGQSIHDVLPAAAVEVLEPLLRRVIATDTPVVDVVATLAGPLGETREFVSSYYPVRDPQGGVSGVAVFVVERAAADPALRGAAERLRRVAESGIIGLFFWSLDGGITDANDAFLATLGYTRDDLAAGRIDWRRMTPPEYAARDEAHVRELLATGTHGQYAKEYFAKDGRRVPVIVTSALLEGSSDRGVCICLDDSARRTATDRLARVLRQTPAAVAVLLGAGHVVQSTNEMFQRLFGRRDYVGRPAREAAPELAERGLVALLDRVYRTGVPHEGREAPLRWDRDGDGRLHEGYFDFVYQPLVDGAGSVEGILVFAVDVTAQVRARAQTEHAARRTAHLQSLTAALAGARTVDDVAEVIIAQAVDAADAKTGMVALRDGDEIVIVRRRGMAPIISGRVGRVSVDAPTPTAHCIRTGAPLWVESAAELHDMFPEFRDAWEKLGIDTLASVPLTVAGETVGAMSFTFDGPAEMGPDEREFFLALGRQAAQAIERARLFEAEREARARAEGLQALTAALAGARTLDEIATIVVAEMVAALGARTGAMIVRAPDTADLVLVRDVGFPPAAAARVARQAVDSRAPVPECFRTASPVWIERRDGPDGFDARYPGFTPVWDALDVSSGAFVPLIAAGEAVGVISFAFATPRTFAAAERAFLLALGRQAALAVERARLFEAERVARHDAEAANRAKSEFLAVMSHELRTPLNAIGGYAELLDMGLRGPVTPQQREDLSRIQRSQQHLLGLINEVLNYARLETGAVRYDVADVGVGGVIAAVESLVLPQLRAKGLTLEIAPCTPTLEVRGDAEKMRQILLNLLSNAVKFTEPGGSVSVTAHARPDGVVDIAVADTGVGIAADQLEAIFEPFVQVGRSLNNPVEGTGLGLAISRDLARGMGGDLTVESAVGAGSTFTLTLRAAAER